VGNGKKSGSGLPCLWLIRSASQAIKVLEPVMGRLRSVGSIQF